ncbi:lipoprotein LpqV [Mycobacterium heckeshornense]|uniref:lipoprotein LpqV n=2 Tax=Mycobacterium heckeshornense TaxID=110505 RepID=UPI0006624562|nr:lipoprotein LpqV [Mycobacterium heckeshornense]KMV21421.1 LpqV [Mycobacterium heckeshornense]
MRWRRYRSRVRVAIVAAGLPMIASCASADHEATAPPPATLEPLPATSPPPPGAIGVSPGGVTTKVDVPADSSQDEYALACRAAKQWMASRGGDPHTQIEPYLATLQSPTAKPGTATFNRPWAQLTPGQQAAVIVAVQAAADDQCG